MRRAKAACSRKVRRRERTEPETRPSLPAGATRKLGSGICLAKRCHLIDQNPEPWMLNLQREDKPTLAQLGMADRHAAGRNEAWKPQAPAEHAKEIAVATEHQRAGPGMDRHRHAEPITEILLDAGRAAEALRRVDDLWKAVAAGAEPGPDLPAGRHVLGDGDDHRHMGIRRGRQRCAD